MFGMALAWIFLRVTVSPPAETASAMLDESASRECKPSVYIILNYVYYIPSQVRKQLGKETFVSD